MSTLRRSGTSRLARSNNVTLLPYHPDRTCFRSGYFLSRKRETLASVTFRGYLRTNYLPIGRLFFGLIVKSIYIVRGVLFWYIFSVRERTCRSRHIHKFFCPKIYVPMAFRSDGLFLCSYFSNSTIVISGLANNLNGTRTQPIPRPMKKVTPAPSNTPLMTFFRGRTSLRMTMISSLNGRQI